MIILGVDPGTLITGFGVLEERKGRLFVLACDVVRNNAAGSMPIRLKKIYDKLCDIIDRYHPDEFAIETAFYGKNAQSALKLGHARGVSILAAVNYQIPTAEYSPREVKKAVVGNGAASKEQVQYMMKTLLGLREVPKYYDATDALAVALCHYHRLSRNGSKRGRVTTRKRSVSGQWDSFVRAHPDRVVQNK